MFPCVELWQKHQYLYIDKNTDIFNPIFLPIAKVRSSYHLCVDYFSQLSFDSEMYTKSATAVAVFVYISESNESWEKHST